MTEPIAVDVPGKPAFARSLAAPVPGPAPAPALKVDAPKLPEVAKLAGSAAAVALGAPPVTPAPLPSTSEGGSKLLGPLLASVGKKRAVVAASALISLAAGVAGVRLMFPGTDTTTPSAALSTNTPTPATKAPTPSAEPPVTPGPGDRLPAAGVPPYSGPAAPFSPTGSALPPIKPTTIHPVSGPLSPPALVVEQPKSSPTGAPVPPPGFDIPVAPFAPSGGVVPIAATEPPKSPVGSPPIPPLPAIPPGPGGMTTLPPLPGVSPGEPKTPDLKLPDPKLPDPVFPVAPPSTPVTPKLPDPKLPDPTLPPIPTPGGMTGTPPSVLPPIDVTPKPPPSAPGPPTVITKPAGATEVKPLVPDLAPKTDFDVDLYEPKAGDTYESISQEYYNDRRFATALRAFNQNQPLGARYVNVPPIHILKRRFPAQTGGTPAGATTPIGAQDWGPASKADPAIRPAGNTRGTFVIPQGGMSMRAVARYALGSEQRWRDIYDLNPQFRSDEVLPAGTELRMPADARLP